MARNPLEIVQASPQDPPRDVTAVAELAERVAIYQGDVSVLRTSFKMGLADVEAQALECASALRRVRVIEQRMKEQLERLRSATCACQAVDPDGD